MDLKKIVHRKSAKRIASVLLASFIATILLVWSGEILFAPDVPPQNELDYVTVKVSEGEVSSSVTLNAVASWSSEVVGVNRAAGVVTSLNIEQGEVTTAGSVLFSVNARPVSIGQGVIPSFRDLSTGDFGDDVKQLQTLLRSLNIYTDEVHGHFDWQTEQAVKAWQKNLGLQDTGNVTAGEVLYVPQLPARIALDKSILYRGASISGGEPVVTSLPEFPDFEIPVSEAQARNLETGMRVIVANGGRLEWEGILGVQKTDTESGIVRIAVEGLDGKALCAEDCSTVPTEGTTSYNVSVVLIEPVSGLIVPSNALKTTADNSVVLVDRTGKHHPVTVVETAKGMSAIAGVSAGLEVRIPPNDD